MLQFLKRALRKPRANVYGLDHAVLNIQLPPQTMWMNMGYWEHTNDFPEACQALLDQVLTAALSTERKSAVRILDIGCGCGDQSLYLTSLLKGSSTQSHPRAESGITASMKSYPDIKSTESSLRSRHGKSMQSAALPRLESYIGITIEPAQASLGAARLNRENESSIPAKIFCADAAAPTSWAGELEKSTATLAAQTGGTNASTWLLALDTLYHFRPSRLPILRYACNTLNASFMAFDLILCSSITWYDKILLRLVCWGTNAPFGNFISEKEYVDLLVEAGYDATQIEIRDISKHVFGGLAGFIERRTGEARPFGIGMGKYSVARVAFSWWAKGRVVKGVVVVAKRG
ncbi:uncharacterized protein N7515_002819 [Penicillium bovifimosum]|uniref:S-adenosyl-L-methionine-dependent methyltransferase n=1 Tax=Penicillium bovifimosum TaxID=126998 RepID=A0A9W9LA14_9EURO|nr:uncharacterized protein N7515_002819 [Penicillium bovifimosum]KAJ5144032.1 hypothetical protein N7515_002819 [Penicillium bovifimosum]